MISFFGGGREISEEKPQSDAFWVFCLLQYVKEQIPHFCYKLPPLPLRSYQARLAPVERVLWIELDSRWVVICTRIHPYIHFGALSMELDFRIALISCNQEAMMGLTAKQRLVPNRCKMSSNTIPGRNTKYNGGWNAKYDRGPQIDLKYDAIPRAELKYSWQTRWSWSGSLVLFCPFQPFPGFSFTKSCLSSFPFNQTWRSNCRYGQQPWSWRWWWIDWQRLKLSNCSKYLCQFHIGFEFFCPLLNPPFGTRLPPLRPSDDSAKRLITIFRLKISEPGRAGIASERN